MPRRATGFQSTGTFTDDSSLYDGSLTSGYTVTGGLLATVAITGKLDLGAGAAATKSVKFYFVWEDSYTYLVESSPDDITYTAGVGSYGAAILNGAGGAAFRILTLTTATSFRYWRVSVQNQDFGSGFSSVSLREIEARDASAVHINENPTGIVSVTGTSTTTDTTVGTTVTNLVLGSSLTTVSSSGTTTVNAAVSGKSSNHSLTAGFAVTALYPVTGVSSNISSGVGVATTSDIGAVQGTSRTESSSSAVLTVIQQVSALSTTISNGTGSTGGVIMMAQSGFDYIDWYPGIGDVFGFTDGKQYDNGKYRTADGKIDGSIELRAGKILRGAAWGVVLGQVPRSSYSDAMVYATETFDPKAPSGSGKSDSDGRYLTGTPGGRGLLAITTECRAGSTPYPGIGTTFNARKRNRNSFLITQPAKYSAICACSERGWIHVGVLKKIYTYFSGTNELAFKSGDLAPDSWAVIDWDSRRAALFMLGVITTTFRVYISEDAGLTVTELNSMTAKTGALCCDSARGMVIVMTSDNSDTINQTYSLDGGSNWSTPVAAILDGTTMKGSILSMDYDIRQAALFMTMNATGSNPQESIVKSTDTGFTWETSIR